VGKWYALMAAAKILSLNVFSLMNAILINHSNVQDSPVFVQGQELSVLNLLLRAVEALNHCVQMEIAAQIVKRALTISPPL
jgi:hypothetical protein